MFGKAYGWSKEETYQLTPAEIQYLKHKLIQDNQRNKSKGK